MCLCLTWLVVLAFLSHGPVKRPVLSQISGCSVPLTVYSYKHNIAFPKNCWALEEDMMMMVPV